MKALAFLVAVALSLLGCDARPTVVASAHTSPVAFETPHKLQEHFQKHGKEVGAKTVDEYLAMAQNLRDAIKTDEILEKIRSDGATSRFDKSTGNFIAYNPDKTIRTFFRPNDGERYYHRQLKTDH